VSIGWDASAAKHAGAKAHPECFSDITPFSFAISKLDRIDQPHGTACCPLRSRQEGFVQGVVDLQEWSQPTQGLAEDHQHRGRSVIG